MWELQNNFARSKRYFITKEVFFSMSPEGGDEDYPCELAIVANGEMEIVERFRTMEAAKAVAETLAFELKNEYFSDLSEIMPCIWNTMAKISEEEFQ